MRAFLQGRGKSFGYAFEGMRYVFATQKNAWIHLAVIVLVISLAAWLGLAGRDYALILLAIGLVLGAEFFNTAVETLVDLVSPEHSRLAKIAKDVAAGGVLLCALVSVGIGILLMGPPLLERLALTIR